MCKNAENKVSVVIPTYKRDVPMLSRAIGSVLNQTYKNIEIIVVDDSPDTYEGRKEVAEYMGQLCSEHGNIIYIQNEKNMGGALARNRGIEAATGSFISFLDDDDEYRPDKIKNQINFMSGSDLDMTFGNMIMHDNAGKVVDVREYHDIDSFTNDSLLRYHLLYHMTGTPTFMYRTEKLRGIGGFDDAKVGQEFYLMLKSIEKGLRIGYLDEYDVIVYKHDGEAISSGKNKIIGENTLYEFKHKYFPILTRREKTFIRFRHYVVMAVAYKRNSMYLKMIGAGLLSVIISPKDFVGQTAKFATKILKHKNAR